MKIKDFIKKFKKDPKDDCSLWAMIIVLFVTYLAIYCFFLCEGFFSTGIGLDKKDWLSFWGSFLCFSGTVYIGYATLLQTKNFTDMSYKRLEKERLDRIQPIFVLSINEINYFFCNNERIISSFQITIKNLGEFPVLDVWLSHEFVTESISPNESISVCCLISGSELSLNQNLKQIVLNDFITQKLKELPSIIDVDYVDIDGHNMIQRFQLGKFIDKNLYSLIFKGSPFISDEDII